MTPAVFHLRKSAPAIEPASGPSVSHGCKPENCRSNNVVFVRSSSGLTAADSTVASTSVATMALSTHVVSHCESMRSMAAKTRLIG